MTGSFPPGSTVVVRDEEWRVVRVDPFDRCAVITLEAAGCRRLRVIEPFDSVVPAHSARMALRRRQTVMRAALQAAVADRPPIGLWTAARASIDLLPYQLQPALAVLQGATRVLLADDVGLGKTIQAGLILSELRERGWVERALVLCPPGLRSTWAQELAQRFGIACAIFDQSAIADAVAALPASINPWGTHATVITSIDFAKRPEVMAAITAVPFDMVIADEVHHLAPGTDRGEAACMLSARAPWCVLLSATPHSGDDEAFDYLTRVGRHGDPMSIFRRSRVDAGHQSARRERVVRIQPDAAELELLRGVERYTRAIWRGKGAGDAAVRLIAITIARRAASSHRALERTLRRRASLLSSVPDAVQPRLPWDEEDDGDDAGSSELLCRPGFENESEERAAIAELLALLDRCGRDSKIRWIVRALARIKEPAIVFTEYRDTLEALMAALPDAMRAVAICGATPIDLRRRAVDALNRGEADVLVATDAAGEGLNLHHRCRLVIDVELPWNPMRLEQRLGRVDRLGQRRRVHAWRLFHPGTIEERVLERLQLRRRRAASLGTPAPVDERAIAAAVFVLESGNPAEAARITGTVVPGVDAEHARVVRQRTRADGSVAAAHSLGSPPARRSNSRMIALHTVTYVNDFGSIVAERPCAHAVDVDAARARTRLEALGQLGASQTLLTSLRQQSRVQCDAITADLEPLRRALQARITAIRSDIAAQQFLTVQQSLFDRRTDQAAVIHESTAARLDAALHRRALSIGSPLRPDAVFNRLIALWPMDRR